MDPGSGECETGYPGIVFGISFGNDIHAWLNRLNPIAARLLRRPTGHRSAYPRHTEPCPYDPPFVATDPTLRK
jgi:hypothetical protein